MGCIKTYAEKKYDIVTSERIGSYTTGKGESWLEETLYRKRSGEYYLKGSGGDDTRWRGTDGVQPLCRAWAESWVFERLGREEYDRIFARPAEPKKKQRITLELPADTYARLTELSESAGVSKTRVIEKLLQESEG